MGVRQKGQMWWCIFGLLMTVAFVVWLAGPTQARQQKITGKDGAPMVLVPAGEFTMGSNEVSDDEKPVHRVFLDAYYIDKYEVTVGQYAKFLEAAGMNGPPMWTTMDQPLHQKRPVVNVDWSDASNYCEWAGKRLPTEAEWEKAARGTDGRMYPWGNNPPDGRRANYGKEKWNNHAALVPVGQLEDGKSPYGIYDLAGNVWEWVSDWYDPDYYTTSPSRNPKGPESGKYRVLRGGSWDFAPENLRSARRDFNIPLSPGYESPAYRNFNSGFRCAKNQEMVYPREPMPLSPVPADYADKHMPAGWWTDPKIIEEGRQIYSGAGNALVNCRSCHKDGQPVKSGGGLHDQKNTSRFSDSYWFWRVAEGVPKTTMMPWKSLLSEEEMWKVIAFTHQFSHGGKPSEHTDYKP
jgi:formylglycine-generating enzyme required for sulfatase activity/mono/diheme cytochrome c family protein